MYWSNKRLETKVVVVVVLVATAILYLCHCHDFRRAAQTVATPYATRLTIELHRINAR